MKKITHSLLIAAFLMFLSFTFSSCEKLKEKLNFNIDNNQDIMMDIPPAPAGGKTTVSAVPFNLKAHIDAQNTSGNNVDLKKIEYIKVTALQIDIIEGATPSNNFANFEDGGVLISSNATTSTQARVTMASFLNNPDAYSTRITIPVTGAAAGKDFKEYLQGTALEYILSYTLRRPLTNTLRCKIRIVWEINVQG